MSDASHQSSVRPRRLLLAALSIALASAGAGYAVFGANATDALPSALAAEAAVNVSGGATVNTNDALVQAAAGAKEVAESAGFRSAVGSFWKVAWEKSWPFIKSMTLKFFGLFGQAWRAIAASFRGSTSANLNASVNAGAATNASTNAP